jgi:DNA-binding response OmpR family regulator
MRILLVEDTVGEPILKVLVRWGYEATLAQDAEEAWDILQRQPLDFVLVDWMLPGASGVDLVKNIRQDARLRLLPVVMISGRSDKADIVTAVRAGVNSYIAKPFTPGQLKKKIESVVEKQPKPLDAVELERICKNNLNFDRFATNPLVLVGEGAKTLEELQRPHRQEAARLLLRLDHVIGQFNDQQPELDVGYLVEDNTHDLTQRLNQRGGCCPTACFFA